MYQIRIHRNSITLLMVLLSLVLISACANGKAMSQKQQATIWMEVYVAQFDDTMSIMTSTTSTPEQKATALKKRAVLVQVWPLLRTYVEIVNAGGKPDDKLVQDLTASINNLTAIATGGH